jgi:translation initiation factor 2B subunit (eIF-2B alpha/beta/delta family)
MLENFLRNSREAPGRIARHFAKALRQDCIALTLGSSTCVLECLRFCRQKIKEVIVAESRPLYEGRSVCRLLAGEGFSTTLITDAQMGIFAREADIAVTGADAILPTGEVINRAGTRLLALAAKDAGIPMCVLSETHKIHPGPLEGFEPLIGEEHPDQVLGDPVPGMRVRNVVYDRTPPELITALITEVGLLRQPAVLDMAKKIIGDTSQ